MLASDKFLELRRKAEEFLKRTSIDNSDLNYQDVEKLIEELNMHQIELEMQNHELSKSNQIIEEERGKYESLYMDAPVAYFTLNETGNIIHLNHAAANLLKRPISSFYRTSIFPYLEKESKNYFSRYFKKVFETEKLEFGIITFINAQKELVVTRLNAIAYYDNEHKAKLCKCVALDITEQYRAEQLVEKKAEQMAFLNQFTNDLLKITDLHNIYKLISNSISHLLPNTVVLCISIDEKNEMTKLESVAGIDNSLLENILSLANFDPVGKTYKLLPNFVDNFRLGKLKEFEGGLEEFSAEQIPSYLAHTISSLLKFNKIYTIGINNNNQLLAAVHFFTFHDAIIEEPLFIEAIINQCAIVLQKKIAEIKLSENEQKLSKIFEVLDVGLLLSDKDGNIVDCNYAATSILGMTKEEFLSKNLASQDWNILKEDGSNMPIEEFGGVKSLANNEKVQNLVMGVVNSNGEMKWLSVNAAPLEIEGYGTVVSFIDITKRKNAEQAVNESNERLLSILNSIEGLVYISDLETYEILFVNEYGTKLMGDVVGHKCYNKLQGLGDVCDFCNNHLLINEQGQPSGVITWEFQNLKTGWWFDCRDRAIRWTDGRLVRMEIATDITNRKILEQALRENEEKYHVLFEDSSDAYLLIEDGKIIESNKSSALLIHVEKSELLGKSPADFSPEFQPDGSNSFEKANEYTELALKNGSVQFEWMHSKADGSLFWADIILTALTINNRKVVFANWRDINQRKIIEEQLAESNERMEMFFKQSLDGFFFMMLDEPIKWDATIDKENTMEYVFAHHRITKVNDAMLEQYNAKRENFLGLTPNDLFAHDLKHGKEVWTEFFDKGKLHIDTQEMKFDGTPMIISGDYICLYDKENRIIGHFGVQRDVTQERRAEEVLKKSEIQLKELNIAKDKLFSIIAHDLKSPFGAIIGLLRLLDEEGDSIGLNERTNIVSMLFQSSQKVHNLLENLLEWSRIQMRKIEVKSEIVDLNFIVNNILDINKLAAENKQIQLINSVQNDFKIQTVPQFLTTILRNLISNAIKFTNLNGNVKIIADESKDEYTISVIDNGIGMSEDTISKLFKMGEEVGIAGTIGESGTGFGLLICKDYIEQLGGKILIESKLGVGSTFTIAIPKE